MRYASLSSKSLRSVFQLISHVYSGVAGISIGVLRVLPNIAIFLEPKSRSTS